MELKFEVIDKPIDEGQIGIELIGAWSWAWRCSPVGAVQSGRGAV